MTRIVQLANFVTPTSGGLRTVLRAGRRAPAESRNPARMCGAISPGPVTKCCQSPAPNQMRAAANTGWAARSNSQPTWSACRCVQPKSVTSSGGIPSARSPVGSWPPPSSMRAKRR